MNAKHTPGPWTMRRVDASHPTQLVYCQILKASDAKKNKSLAYAGVYGKRKDGDGPGEPGQDEDECLANARLIAAAPALLAACEAAIEATGGSQNWSGETQKFLLLCEAAVAQAKGTP